MVNITLSSLLTEGTRTLDTSRLSFAAIECLVSGVLGIRLIRAQRKASSRFKLNSRTMMEIPLEEHRSLSGSSYDIYMIYWLVYLLTCRHCFAICAASDTKTPSNVSFCGFPRDSRKSSASSDRELPGKRPRLIDCRPARYRERHERVSVNVSNQLTYARIRVYLYLVNVSLQV